MKFLSVLSPVLNLLKNFGLLYRLIGLVVCFIFFSGNFKDFLFLSQSNGAKPMTVEDIIDTPNGELPRYIKLENVAMASSAYLATQDEETGAIVDASYPVYSINQLANYDTLNPLSLITYVIVKDKNFNEDSLSFLMNIEGVYDNESFTKTMNMFAANDINVSPDAILLVKEKAPSFNSSLLWSVLSGLGGLLILLSFIPSGKLEESAASSTTTTTSTVDELLRRKSAGNNDEFV